MNEMSPEITALFVQARNGELEPIDFCKALDRYGIHPVQKMLYVRNAFRLPLEQAKKILLEAEYGSVETWSEEMGSIIEDLGSQIENSSDPDLSEVKKKR